MSCSEYFDLYLNCQDTAPYHLFVYDMVDSKQHAEASRQVHLLRLIFGLESKVEQLERKTGRTILHRGTPIIHNGLVQKNGHYQMEPQWKSNQMRREDLVDPVCMQGDCLVLTVLRDRITAQEMDVLFEETKKELRIPYDFHKANGYYETDEWTEGQTRYFRGYAIALLSSFHKEDTKQALQAAKGSIKTLMKKK